jgi:hypothetical protein
VLVRAIDESLVDLAEDHDDPVLLFVGDRFVVDDGLVELYGEY